MPKRSRAAKSVSLGPSQRTKANSPRSCVQAGRAEVLVEVQGDLAVGAGAEAVAPALEVALHALEVVELAVDDDPQALVLAGDRLIAGRQVDDAEPGVAQPDPPIAGDPRPLSVRPAVGESEGRLLQGGGRDRSPRRVHRHNPTHAEPPFLIRPSSGWASSPLEHKNAALWTIPLGDGFAPLRSRPALGRAAS